MMACRCCGAYQGESDHCPECGCEQFEERSDCPSRKAPAIDPKRLPDFVYGRTTYVVEKFAETGDILKAKYILRGPRGAEYCLIPNKPNPALLFAINSRNFTKGSPFDGKWFTEKDGKLVLA